MTSLQTWHYGLVAKWWAEFNVDGPEIDYFRRFIEEGQPALDVACGTGRLLLPYLRAGLDVDGCDISPDMVGHCRRRAEQEGLTPRLFVQPMHELDPPRRYRTIVVCGGVGLGSTRDQDQEAFRRFHNALEPGGRLVFDNEAPYANPRLWQMWTTAEHERLPEAWRENGDRRPAADGSELELRSRIVALDRLDQRLRLELRALEWRDGVVVAEETHVLDMRTYFKDELVLMLEAAGFAEIEVSAGYTGAEPTGDEEFLVFTARKGS
jgi:SAM-dependent methyltransferase